MTEPERDSLIGAAILVAFCLIMRRHLFSLSTIMGFFVANVTFGFVGIFLLPWALAGDAFVDDLRFGFGFLDWSLITEADVSKTILLYVGGFMFVVLGHHAVVSVRIVDEQLPLTNARELIVGRLVGLTVLASGFVATYMLMNPAIFLAGLQSQLLGGDKAEIYTYRGAATNNYAFVLVVYNVLPFLATALWLRARSQRPTLLFLGFTVGSVLLAALSLLLTFQKMPLMIFMIGLAVVEISVRRKAKTRIEQRTVWRAPLLIASLLFVISALQSMMKGGEAAAAPLRVSILEIIGRISVGSPLFVHYFPGVEAHYGLSDVGMVGYVTGQPVYESTAAVFQYFTGSFHGSGAVGEIIEFYCAFGWLGWIFGNLSVGVVLAFLDKAIKRLPRGEPRLLALVFSFVFCMHLGQASIFNASFGYGGFFFVVLWTVLCPRVAIEQLGRSGLTSESSSRGSEHSAIA